MCVCAYIYVYLISPVNERGRVGNTGPSIPELMVLLDSEINWTSGFCYSGGGGLSGDNLFGIV